MKHQGFTLIELLMVILIIGILAAIALPQYQNSVVHGRFAQLQITASAIRFAAQRSWMSNGKAPTDFGELDLDFSGDISEDGTELVFKKGICQYYGSDGHEDYMAACYLTVSPFVGYLFFYHKKDRYCLAPADEETAQNFCLTLGGEEVDSEIEEMIQYSIP